MAMLCMAPPDRGAGVNAPNGPRTRRRSSRTSASTGQATTARMPIQLGNPGVLIGKGRGAGRR